MANINPELSFTHDHIVHDDGRVEFACSTDTDPWPWLALPPHHPIVTQNLQFWASVGASTARGNLDGSKWTALTWTKWNCGPRGAAAPVRGEASQYNEGGRDHYLMRLFDAAGVETYEMHGTGVVFRTRDFEGWRAKAKEAAKSAINIDDFRFAPPESVGSGEVGPSLLGPLLDGDTPSAEGLIAADNAMPPAHPFMSGSGDHVNATHIAEAMHQFVHLLEDGKPQRVTSGEMRFDRYVELGAPFRIVLDERSDGEVTAIIEQGGRDCSLVTLRFEPA